MDCRGKWDKFSRSASLSGEEKRDVSQPTRAWLKLSVELCSFSFLQFPALHCIAWSLLFFSSRHRYSCSREMEEEDKNKAKVARWLSKSRTSIQCDQSGRNCGKTFAKYGKNLATLHISPPLFFKASMMLFALKNVFGPLPWYFSWLSRLFIRSGHGWTRLSETSKWEPFWSN